jgi:hypothetical protein
MSVTRDRVRQLVEELPEDALAEAAEYLEWLAAEEDTEPLSAEEERQLAASEGARARGEFIEWDFEKELGGKG